MNALTTLKQSKDAALARLFELVAIPSISTDPAYHEDCVRAADWHVADLNSIGFDARRVDTKGKPIVVAHSPKVENAPTVLFYGHYDVQPVDPLDLWDHPPFEAQLLERNDETVIHGRGASDDKGQVMTFIEACRALAATDGLPINVKIMLEGEEESGSPSLPAFFKEFGEEIHANIVLVCDTGMVNANQPAISAQLRGLMGEEITIHAAKRDLHSGLYGGAARNPIQVLSEILAALRDESGKVQLPGFYDGVSETSDEMKADWARLAPLYDNFLKDVGLSLPAGETGYSLLEMLWARPTLEINGIYGGYTGEGFKTVLPAEASAKISCRLVGTQDPHAIRESLHKFVNDRLPEDCTASFAPHGASPATVMNVKRDEFQKAQNALTEVFPEPAVFIGMGGSIPITNAFKNVLGMDSLLIGFALDNDNIHAPNEKYNLSSFERGQEAWLRILTAFGETN